MFGEYISAEKSNFLLNILNSQKRSLVTHNGAWNLGSKLQMKIPDNPCIVGVVSFKWREVKTQRVIKKI